ncbi:hypothetical protein [Paenibacillus odorifer]|uniref:hypothetical protein n=1 Tax=Paenibacillus odorifer TaxID=189426 RepID=UPI0015C3966A|nr:hypothetical protein [Paenibacillus odorifer]
MKRLFKPDTVILILSAVLLIMVPIVRHHTWAWVTVSILALVSIVYSLKQLRR